MEIFETLKGAYSAVRGRIGPNFELIRDIIVVFLTCKNEEDLIKNEGASLRVLQRLYIDLFFTHSRAANSTVHGGIPPKFELIQALIVFLVTCKNDEDSIRNKGDYANNISPIISLWDFFFKRPRAANSAVLGRIGPKFKHIQDIMVVLLTCKKLRRSDPK